MTRKERYKLAYAEFMKVYPFSTEDLPGEKWVNFTPRYQISSYGRVKSFCKRKVRILKPLLSNCGYLFVAIYDLKKEYQDHFFIHRLVAETFCTKLESKTQVNHIDGHKFNNYIENLEWCSARENLLHALATGLKVTKCGEDNYQAGVTNEQAEKIREMYIPYSKDFGSVALSKLFGISDSAVLKIVQGRSYKKANGTIRKKTAARPRISKEIRTKIRTEYIAGSKEYGSIALSKKYRINYRTVLIIVHEND